jgi:TRAP transporter TAXI family solute receptor
MKKQRGRDLLFGVVLAICSAAFIAAPGITVSKAQAQKPTPGAGTSGFPKTMFIISGAPTGSGEYAATLAISEAMGKHFGIPVRTTTPEAVRDRYYELRTGAAQMIYTDAASNPALSLQGDGAFAAAGEGPQQLRVGWFNTETVCTWVVRGDSDIKSIYDIKGRRVVKATHSPLVLAAFEGLLAFTGLTEKEVTVLPVGSWAGQVKAVGEGKGDIGYTSNTTSAAIEVQAGPRGLRWLPMPHKDKEAWKRYLNAVPTDYPAIMSRGVKEAVGVEGTATGRVITFHANASEEFVYQIVKFMGEQYNSYKDKYATLADASLQAQRKWLDVCPLPYHPGAIKYLKEIGVWTAKDDVWNAEAGQLAERYQKAWQVALKKAQEQGITASVTNPKWLSLWGEVKREIPPFKTRM